MNVQNNSSAPLLPCPAAIDELPEAVIDAVAAALGDAYDCLRVWSAWSYGTMGPDDFGLVAEDGERIAEIARAAIEAYVAVTQAVAAQAPAAVAVPEGAREAFETWAPTQHMRTERWAANPTLYDDENAISAWQGWEAGVAWALAATPSRPATEYSSAGGLAEAVPASALNKDALYLLRRLLSNQHTFTGTEFRLELAKIVEDAQTAAERTSGDVLSPYSIDEDSHGIRERVAFSISGALGFGAQGVNPPPAGHWLAPFWESANADREKCTAPQAQPADALDAAPAAPINSEALQVIKALREWVMAVPADVTAALPAMPGIDADWMDAVEAALATHSAPADGLMVDMTPPATSRDRWMYNQGRLAEVERICAAIKTEDDYCVDEGDYMLDSDDCIKVARGTWLRPTFDRAAMAAAQEGGKS